MSRIIEVHPEHPQPHRIGEVVKVLEQGGVIAYPTESGYALGCLLDNKQGAERIRAIRRLPPDHDFTLMCRDLSELATYARVDNQTFRALKGHTPGAFTFILEATSEVPKRLMHPKRKTIGMRVPDNAIALALMEELGEPLMTSSLLLPGEEYPLTDPYDIRQTLEHQLELVIDGGFCGMEATTVIDMTGDAPELLRQGLGDASDFID